MIGRVLCEGAAAAVSRFAARFWVAFGGRGGIIRRHFLEAQGRDVRSVCGGCIAADEAWGR